MQPRFFENAELFRKWLERHHESESEVLVGFYKKGSGQPSITWPESVDQALCFGWIDGVRKRIDDVSYTIRFTPRRRGSIWSRVNIGRVKELKRLGLMHASGLRAFGLRSAKKSGVYSYENEPALAAAEKKQFRAAKRAWKFFSEQPPSYRRQAIGWVVNAKREETRARRLATLIDDSAHGRRLAYTVGKKS